MSNTTAMSKKTVMSNTTAMSIATARRLIATVLTSCVLSVVAAVAMGTGSAYARVAPDGPEFVTQPSDPGSLDTDVEGTSTEPSPGERNEPV